MPARNDQGVALGYWKGVQQRDGVLAFAGRAFGTNDAKWTVQLIQDMP